MAGAVWAHTAGAYQCLYLAVPHGQELGPCATVGAVSRAGQLQGRPTPHRTAHHLHR